MTDEEVLSDYMQRYYGDCALAALLCHAEDGRLAFMSCCCFIGVPLAVASGAALHGASCGRLHRDFERDYATVARDSNADADSAEDAFCFFFLAESDAERRAKLIPLIKQEFQRRESLRNLTGELREFEKASRADRLD